MRRSLLLLSVALAVVVAPSSVLAGDVKIGLSPGVELSGETASVPIYDVEAAQFVRIFLWLPAKSTAVNATFYAVGTDGFGTVAVKLPDGKPPGKVLDLTTTPTELQLEVSKIARDVGLILELSASVDGALQSLGTLHIRRTTAPALSVLEADNDGQIKLWTDDGKLEGVLTVAASGAHPTVDVRIGHIQLGSRTPEVAVSTPPRFALKAGERQEVTVSASLPETGEYKGVLELLSGGTPLQSYHLQVTRQKPRPAPTIRPVTPTVEATIDGGVEANIHFDISPSEGGSTTYESPRLVGLTPKDGPGPNMGTLGQSWESGTKEDGSPTPCTGLPCQWTLLVKGPLEAGVYTGAVELLTSGGAKSEATFTLRVQREIGWCVLMLLLGICGAAIVRPLPGQKHGVGFMKDPGDLTVELSAAVVTLTTGVVALYFAAEPWGSCVDFIVAFMFGAGIQKVGASASTAFRGKRDSTGG